MIAKTCLRWGFAAAVAGSVLGGPLPIPGAMTEARADSIDPNHQAATQIDHARTAARQVFDALTQFDVSRAIDADARMVVALNKALDLRAVVSPATQAAIDAAYSAGSAAHAALGDVIEKVGDARTKYKTFGGG